MPETLQIILLSLQISGMATAISLALGLPLGTLLALSKFPGRSFLLSLVNTGMGLPPVVVGLFVAIMLWRSGPLGDLRLIYTPAAIIIAQVIIAFPVVTGLTAAALQALDPRLQLQLRGLGASTGQMVLALWLEARLPLLAALMAGFGSVISEVGASMMVGGNIRGQTRVLTTAIVLETSKGAFDIAIQLGILLLAVTFLVNWALTVIQQKGRAVEIDLLKIRNLTIRRAGRVVLEVEQLTIRKNEVLAVVGPNGAGKSTLLLALARLLRPERGEIEFHGSPSHEESDLEYRRRLAMVLQEPLLFDMTVYENVASGLRFRSWSNTRIKPRVEMWLAHLGILHLATRRASQLSGGEGQRVSLARAMVLEPELLLLDEPFGGLDTPTRCRLLDDLGVLLSKSDTTTIFITHNLEEARKLAGRIAVIMDGRLLACDEPEAILRSFPQLMSGDGLGQADLA